MQNLLLRHRLNHTRAHEQSVHGSSLTLENTVRAPLRSLTITGQSVQEGTPSPQAPAPIQSVGSPSGFTLKASGKNLFDKSEQFQRLCDYAATYTGATDVTPVKETFLGRQAVKCRARTLAQGGSNIFCILEGEFEPGTQYTLSFDYTYDRQTEGSTKGFFLHFQYTDGSYSMPSIGNEGQTVQYRRKTATSTAGKTIARIVYTWNTEAVCIYLDFNSFQIEKGAVSTSYLPYFAPDSQIFPTLRSMPGGVADTITIDQSGMATLYRRVGTFPLNGSEAWQKTTNGATDEKNFFYIGGIRRDETIPPICDYFVHRNINAGEANTGFVTTSNATRFRPNLAEVTDVESWKKWLAEHPVTMQYALSEPVTEPLGTVSLITKPYYTNIFSDSSLSPQLTASILILG